MCCICKGWACDHHVGQHSYCYDHDVGYRACWPTTTCFITPLKASEMKRRA